MHTGTQYPAGSGRDLRPERRASERRRSFKGARLVFNGGYGVFECVVRDQSAQGARLMFGDATGVPACFELQISGVSARHAAEVMWRRPRMIGVSFRKARQTAYP